jgi:hypothetical protein
MQPSVLRMPRHAGCHKSFLKKQIKPHLPHAIFPVRIRLKKTIPQRTKNQRRTRSPRWDSVAMLLALLFCDLLMGVEYRGDRAGAREKAK